MQEDPLDSKKLIFICGPRPSIHCCLSDNSTHSTSDTNELWHYSDSFKIVHIIHTKRSVTGRTITTCNFKSCCWTFVCECVYVAPQCQCLGFNPNVNLNYLHPSPIHTLITLSLSLSSLDPSFSFTLLGNLPCNCCSLHHRIA